MISHGEGPFLECSSLGDKRFSAFYARIQRRGDRTIEEIYQNAKVFEDGSTNVGIKKAKGRKPVNQLQCIVLYRKLWNEYIDEKEYLLDTLLAYNGLTDYYGQAGHVCQATELWRIREDYKRHLYWRHWGFE